MQSLFVPAFLSECISLSLSLVHARGARFGCVYRSFLTSRILNICELSFGSEEQASWGKLFLPSHPLFCVCVCVFFLVFPVFVFNTDRD
jgi:hypothetical protein